ncbi:LacI family DNA-binding transcriptional regulator [Paenibacillus kribbensis]|uniref:LacI family DNA-binding transcriptional regulator n=1 Tax=Paenibacillus kribbensis TaxID=172713 RepID=UPI0015B8E096|nr:LacI family DNA-binding transcriptional regulator [Paenibacillus kribbensis]
MATIKDISQLTGFSITTVSRALNGYSDVSESTRKLIKEAAEALNYSPNVLARGLVMKETKTLGLLVSGMTHKNINNNFVFEVLCGINDSAASSDYDLILFSTNTAKQKMKTYTQLCRERKVDGVILQGVKTDDPYLQEVLDSDIPCVLIDIPIQSENVGYVSTNHKESAQAAVEHLIRLGHQKIAMINGYSEAFVSKARFEGFVSAMEQAGLDWKREWVVKGDFTEEAAQQQALKLLRAYPEITAFFCASDMMALGVIKAANEMGLSVPGQLSIVGFDDIPTAAYFQPPLTTIGQNMYQLGYEAANLLMRMLKSEDSPKSNVLRNELILRSSTGKPYDRSI